MNMEFRRARALAERGEWAEAAEAYYSAGQMAAHLGATESMRQAKAYQETMEANLRSKVSKCEP